MGETKKCRNYVPSDLTKTHKTCNMCKQILPIEDFSVCDKYGGRRGKCKCCQIEHEQRSKGTWEKYQKEQAYREELHSLQKEGKRRCRMCNEVKILDDFHTSNSQKVFYNRKSYCKCCAYEVWRKPRDQTPEGKLKKSINDKRYKSKPEAKKKVRENCSKKYHNDPAYKVKTLLRGRLGKAIKRKKASQSFVRELGCTVNELVVYLESQFYSNPKTGEMMNWNNHAMDGWHIDHIKPLHEFDLENEDQFKKAAHYTNLQPLWWWQNLEKNKGITYNKKG